jgi:hypothetical protein
MARSTGFAGRALIPAPALRRFSASPSRSSIFLTSGNSRAARAAADVAAVFLPKPYRVSEALRRISALLEDSQQGDE